MQSGVPKHMQRRPVVGAEAVIHNDFKKQWREFKKDNKGCSAQRAAEIFFTRGIRLGVRIETEANTQRELLKNASGTVRSDIRRKDGENKEGDVKQS